MLAQPFFARVIGTTRFVITLGATARSRSSAVDLCSANHHYLSLNKLASGTTTLFSLQGSVKNRLFYSSNVAL